MRLPFIKREPKAQRKFWHKIGTDSAYVLSPTGPSANSARSNSAAVACVEKIIGRAVEIPFTSNNPSAERVLRNPSWMLSVDTIMFWRRVYEHILYDGDAAIMRMASGSLRVGRTDGAAVVSGDGNNTTITRPFRTQKIGDEDDELINVREPDICRLFWAEKGMTPWRLIQEEAIAYKESMDDLYQEAKKARRVSAELDVADALQEQDQLEEKMEEFQRSTNTGSKQMIVPLDKGVEYKPINFGPAAPHDERVRVTLAGVARVYGVPIQLLNAGVDRQTVDEADAHLLRDAVIPLVRKVAAGLSKIFRAEVKPDMSKVGLPSRTGVAGLMMTLSQTGVLTVDEIREQVGFEPLGDERGGEFPQAAGAPETDNGSDGGNGNDNKDQT